MLHNEFEALIGRTATEQEYEIANAMYMACGQDVDKKTFCEDYNKHKDSIILRGIWMAYNQEMDAHNFEANAAKEARENLKLMTEAKEAAEEAAKKYLEALENQETTIRDLKAELESAQEITNKLRHDLGMFLVDRAEHFHSGTLRDEAIELLGLKEYIKAKVERGDDLWRRDMQALITEVIGGDEEIKEALK